MEGHSPCDESSPIRGTTVTPTPPSTPDAVLSRARCPSDDGGRAVAGQGDDEPETIHFLRFNQDCTSLAVGTSSGYKILSITSLDQLETNFVARLDRTDKVTIIERLFSSSLVVVVTQATPRRLQVWHFKKAMEICHYGYSNSILAVKLNRARLIVCLERALYIHNIRDMRILHTIKETPPNPAGLCALSINSDNCYLAYPGGVKTGEVQLFDAFNLQAKLMIPAHESSLAALSFNPSGTRLATASEKGTVIRLFSVEDGTKLMEFRRGVKRCAAVHNLSFSHDSQFLVLSSNTETIHVFKIVERPPVEEEPQQAPGQEDTSWIGYFSKAVSTTASYLPAQVTDTFSQTRSFATVYAPSISLLSWNPNTAHNTAAIANISRQMRLLLASRDGYLYIYNLPGLEGGECMLVKQHRIDPDCSNGTEPSLQVNPVLQKPGTAVIERSKPIDAKLGYRGSPTRGKHSHTPSDEDDFPLQGPLDKVEEQGGGGPAILTVTEQESFDDSPPPALKSDF